MKPTYALATIFFAGLLTACDSGPEVDIENASAEEVARQVSAEGGAGARASVMRPGLWSTSFELTSLEAPNMPAMVREQMQQTMVKREGHETCLSVEDARRPKEDFFTGAGKECRYDHYRMGEGKIDAKMRCEHQGVTQVMEMAGTYGPDHYRMDMTTRADMAETPMGSMTMKMKVEAKRIGECKSGNESAGG